MSLEEVKHATNLSKMDGINLATPVFYYDEEESNISLVLSTEELIKMSREDVTPPQILSASRGIPVENRGGTLYPLGDMPISDRELICFEKIESEWGGGFYGYNVPSFLTAYEANSDGCIKLPNGDDFDYIKGQKFISGEVKDSFIPISDEDFDKSFVNSEFDFISLNNVVTVRRENGEFSNTKNCKLSNINSFIKNRESEHSPDSPK